MTHTKKVAALLVALLLVLLLAPTALADDNGTATYTFQITTTPDGAAALYQQLDQAGYAVEATGDHTYHITAVEMPTSLNDRLSGLVATTKTSVSSLSWDDPAVEFAGLGLALILFVLVGVKVFLALRYRREQARWWNEDPWPMVHITSVHALSDPQNSGSTIDLSSRLAGPTPEVPCEQPADAYGMARENHFQSFGTSAQVHLLRDRLPPRVTLE